MAVQTKATLADLYKEPGKAELVDGKVIKLMPTGGEGGYAADEIFASLREYAKRVKVGRAVSDNKGFRVNLPNRESFSPDAAFYIGANPGMKFYDGAPVFAVEVRSESDYGPEAELSMAKNVLIILLRVHKLFGTLIC
jgi:Uma2 family endonuclease